MSFNKIKKGTVVAASGLTVTGTSTFSNNITMLSTLNVSGNTNLNGTLGIGTGTSTLTFTPNTIYTGTGTATLANSMWIDLPGSGTLSLSDNIILNGGNMGIGVTVPSVLFDVNHGNASGAQSRFTSSGTDAAISIKNTGTSGREFWLGSASSGAGAGAGNFYIYDATSGGGSTGIRMAINSSGMMGVGTINPLQSLHVENGNIGINSKSEMTGKSTLYFYNNPYMTNGNIAAKTGIVSQAINNYTQSKLHLCVNNTNDLTTSASVSDARLTVDTTGNIGINTTTPQTKLDINDSINPKIYLTNISSRSFLSGISGSLDFGNDSGTNSNIRFMPNGSESMRISNGGNVGINNNNPLYLLDINGGGCVQINRNTSNTTNTSNYAGYYSYSQTGKLFVGIDGTGFGNFAPDSGLIGTWTNTHMLLATNSTERVRILNTGYMGVGTTTPLSKLTIKSSYTGGQADGFCIDATDGSVYNLRIYPFVQAGSQVAYNIRVNNVASVVDAMTFGYNGYVGVGVTPAYRLDVAGDINFTGNLYKNGTLFSSGGGSSGSINSDLTVTGNTVLNNPVGNTWQTTFQLNNTTSNASYQLLVGGSGNSSAGVGVGNLGIFGGLNSASAFRFVITPTGNIGIGTNTPSYKLHVYDSVDGGVEQYNQNASAGTSAYTLIGCRNNTPSQLVMFINSSNRTADGGASTATVRNDAGDLRLQANGATNGLHIKSTTGYVGIGTTNPSATLQVTHSSASVSGYGGLLVDSPNSGSAGGTITIRNSSGGANAFASLIFEVDGTTSCGAGTTPLAFSQGNGMLYCMNVGTGGNNAGKLGFIQWNGSTEVETMTILPSGYVGIGTTSPAGMLDVRGTIFGGSIQAITSGAYANGGYITLQPCDAAHTGYIEFRQANTSRQGYIGYATTSQLDIYAEGDASLMFGVGGSDRMRIRKNGNISMLGAGNDNYGINMPTGGYGLTWGAGYSRILDDGDLRICTDDTMHFYSGSNTSGVGTERFRIDNTGWIRTYGVASVENGDSSKTYYGPNGTWGGALYVGSGTYSLAGSTAQVISTNGNLHLDAGTASRSMYLNYYSNTQLGAGCTIQSWGNWTHNNILTVNSWIGVNTTAPYAPLTLYGETDRWSGVAGGTLGIYMYLYSGYSDEWLIGTDRAYNSNMYFLGHTTNGYGLDICAYIENDTAGFRVMNFTGQHRSAYDNTIDSTSCEGLIVRATGEYFSIMDNYDNTSMIDHITIDETLPVISLANTMECPAVFGVVSYTEDPEKTRQAATGRFVSVYSNPNGERNRVYVNSLGEGAVWVCNINGNFTNGDLITTSTVPGYGMKQNSGQFMNYTMGKITTDCDFNPPQLPVRQTKKKLGTHRKMVMIDKVIEHFKEDTLWDETKQRYIKTKILERTETIQVPDEEEVDVYDINDNKIGTEKVKKMITITEMIDELDSNGMTQWIDAVDSDGNIITKPAYKTRYLRPDGTIISKTDYDTAISNGEMVYIAAFVGCTYHCG